MRLIGNRQFVKSSCSPAAQTCVVKKEREDRQWRLVTWRLRARRVCTRRIVGGRKNQVILGIKKKIGKEKKERCLSRTIIDTVANIEDRRFV